MDTHPSTSKFHTNSICAITQIPTYTGKARDAASGNFCLPIVKNKNGFYCSEWDKSCWSFKRWKHFFRSTLNIGFLPLKTSRPSVRAKTVTETSRAEKAQSATHLLLMKFGKGSSWAIAQHCI